MHLQRMSAFLRAEELRMLAAGARRLVALQKIYSAAAPRELSAASRVKTCKGGTIVIVCDNAAVAAKLRQLTAGLLAAIQKSAAELTAIKVEVQVPGAPQERIPDSHKDGLTVASVEKFADLCRRVPKGPLRSAIRKLVKRHSPRKDSVKRQKPGAPRGKESS
jgi:hypothetical protein